jgi:hypothetical protein
LRSSANYWHDRTKRLVIDEKLKKLLGEQRQVTRDHEDAASVTPVTKRAVSFGDRGERTFSSRLLPR